MASSKEVTNNLDSEKDSEVATPINNEEFQEEDIWDCNNSNSNNNIFNEKNQLNSKFIITSIKDTRRLIPSVAKMIPKSKNKNPVQDLKIVHHSALVKIFDWSNIYGTSFNKEIANFGSDDDEEEEVEENVMPPHEWLAKRLSRRQIFAFSMCEGVGKTLKGRDLCRMRNTVLTLNGFLE